ncbi:hypothetical protein QF027_000019 [Streptomyces canus]|nr:hypothetical protein [Streptomyces canus]
MGWLHVKVRDGQVANRPVYVALAVTVDGTRDILGLWAGDGGEGAKYSLQVLTEIKNRGVEDVVPLCGPPGLGQDFPRAQARLHRADCKRGRGPLPGVP